MALPTSRDYDAVDSGPLNAAVVNNIQDAIVGLKHGEVTARVPMDTPRRDLAVNVDSTLQNYEMPASGTNNMKCQIPVRVGDRIKSVSIWCLDIAPGTNGEGVKLTLERFELATSWSLYQLGTPDASARNGTYQKLTVDLTSSPHTVASDESLGIDVAFDVLASDGGGSDLIIFPVIEIVYDRP